MKDVLLVSSMKREKMEDVLLFIGLIGTQFVYAGNSVLSSLFMSCGIHPLTLVISCTFATFLFLTPLAICFERNRWPKKLSLKLILQLVLISFAGVTVFQSLFLRGIHLTSPALATAMPNLAPGLIFIIAWIFRLEKVNISCIYSKVKITGTLLCVAGAVSLSFLHSTSSQGGKELAFLQAFSFNEDKAIGCLYLIGAVFTMSSNVVLQAATLGDFPAPISLCAITSLNGLLITVAIEFVKDHNLTVLWPSVATNALIGYSLLGGAVGGACVSFNGWAMKKRGPVLVSMFCPIGTVCSVVLSIITLSESMNLANLAAMFLMFIGLYFVLWAKGKEDYSNEERLSSNSEAQKPLLS